PVFKREIAVGKWETCFWFSTFPRRSRRSCGNVGISPAFGEISKGLWKEGEACFWLSTLSTTRHFHSSLPLCFISRCLCPLVFCALIRLATRCGEPSARADP